MPTERDKQAEKDRVTRISGFRVGYHDFLAEVDLEALKRRNDQWEAEHRHQSLLDCKTEELIRIAAYVAMRNPPYHIQIQRPLCPQGRGDARGALPRHRQRRGLGRRCGQAERDGGLAARVPP